MTLLPEFRAAAWGNGFIGLYRMKEGADWFHVSEKGKRTVFPTARAAREAAKARVRSALDPPAKAAKPAPRAAPILREYRERQLAEQARAQVETTGGVIVRGRSVAVERRKVR